MIPDNKLSNKKTPSLSKRKGKPMTKVQREQRTHEQRIKQAQDRVGTIFQSRPKSPITPPAKHVECQTYIVENDGSFRSSRDAGNSNPDKQSDGDVNFGGLV